MHDRSPSTSRPAGQVGISTLNIADRPRAAILLLLPVALWIWLCHDWPARLGFYADDWMILLHPFAGTAKAYHDIFNVVRPRPVSAPYIWLAQVIVDWSPARSQFLNAAMLLVTAASVGMLTSALVSVSRIRGGAMAAACVASASFIVFPSTVGTFAWGTAVSAIVPALPLFCLGMTLLLHSECSPWRLGAGLILVLLSHLSYEAFYFQEITIVLLAAALRGSRIKDIPWRVLAGAVIVNVGCVAYNRTVVGGVHKPFNPDFLQTFIWGFSHIGDIFRHATREHDVLVGVSVLGAALFGSICLTRIVGFARMLIAALVVICGIVAAGFLYAFAGSAYGLAVEGIAARVSIVLATYSAIVPGVLAAAVWRATGAGRIPALAFCVCAGIGLVGLGLTARFRVGEWADAWTYETTRLSRLPAQVMSGGDEQRVYLAIEDKPPTTIEPASQPWEISGAIAWAVYKVTNSRLMTLVLWREEQRRWYATVPNWFDRWDGHKFEQGPCGGAVAYGGSGTEFWAWKTSTNELTRIEAPWEYGCK